MKTMHESPQSVRKHIALIGDTNTGKSSLLNALCEQDLALVSAIAGTTTDAVKKSYELLPYGPVVWIDTPGLSDISALGHERMKRTMKELEKADFIILVSDSGHFSVDTNTMGFIKNSHIPYIRVFSKKDLLSEVEQEALVKQFPDSELVSVYDPISIQSLRDRIASHLSGVSSEDTLILADKLTSGDQIILVVPIDSEAPKGRIIGPQNALLREALEYGIICTVCRPSELNTLTSSSTKWSWVITDSQAFKEVDQTLNASYPKDQKPRLTSFSILMSRQKGNLRQWVEGVKHIPNLHENDKILIAEACSHSRSHEDIARIKIPKLLQQHCQKTFRFEFVNGKEFPDDPQDYALIIHCGGCMITKSTMENRRRKANKIPMTNFGIVLAYLAGILPQSIQGLLPEQEP